MDITTILRQRDRASFDWLYNQYAAPLFGIILRMVEEHAIAQNLLKDTFVEAWRTLDQFDVAKGSVFTWMLRIARAKAASYTGHSIQKDGAETMKAIAWDNLADDR